MQKLRPCLATIVALAMLSACTDIAVPVIAEPAPTAPNITTTTTTPPPETEPPPPEKIVLSIADTAAFDEELRQICEKQYVIGSSMAFFANGEIIHTYDYGYEDYIGATPTSTDTKYRVASIAKMVTAIAALQLWEDGKLSLDEPISDLMTVPIGSESTPKITAHHLLTHTSGIQDVTLRKFPPLSTQYANGIFTPKSAPGSSYNYSNLGYGVLGAYLETVSGERITDLTNRTIFDPINADAGFLMDSLDSTEHLANIYYGGNLNMVVKDWNRTSANYYGSTPVGHQYLIAHAEMFSSAVDLAKIGIALADDGSFDGMTLLGSEALELMHTPKVDSGSYEVGYGIRIYDGTVISDRMIYGHPGQAYGMLGGIYYDRLDNCGVAILTNGCTISTYENSMYRLNQDVLSLYIEQFEVSS